MNYPSSSILMFRNKRLSTKIKIDLSNYPYYFLDGSISRAWVLYLGIWTKISREICSAFLFLFFFQILEKNMKSTKNIYFPRLYDFPQEKAKKIVKFQGAWKNSGQKFPETKDDTGTSHTSYAFTGFSRRLSHAWLCIKLR